MWRQRPIKRRPSHRKLRSECAKNEILVYIAQVGKWYVSISKRYKSLYIIFVENNQFNIKRKDISHFFAKIIQHNFFLPETQRKWSNKLVDDPWPSTRYVALDLFQPQQGDRLSQHLQRHFLSQTKLQVERYCLFHTLICIHRLQKSPFCFLKFRQYFKSLFFLRWYIETNWYIFYSLKLAGCGISVSWIICRPRRKIKMCLYELHMTSVYKLQRKLNDRQRGSTTPADVRMVNFFRLAPSMSSLSYWHRSGVACIVYVNQTDFQLHSRFQTTRWPLSSNDILHWPIFEVLLSVPET